jgi:hypothetical protein
MKFSDSHEEMSPHEQHGIQLRLVTDELETRTFDYAFEVITAVLAAEKILTEIRQKSSD